MKKYINLHHLNKIFMTNKISNSEFDNSSEMDKNFNVSDMAQHINKNLYKMDYEEKKYLFQMCLSTYNIHNELLKFEFNNLNPNHKTITLNNFCTNVKKLLIRYQHKVGGFLLEDMTWTLYDHNDGKYNLTQNEVVFENTMPAFHIPKRGESLKDDIFLLKNYCEIEETMIYLNKLTKLLNNLSNNIKISLKFIDSYRDDIIVVILHCKIN